MPRTTSLRALWLTATSVFVVGLAIASWPQRAHAQSTIPSTASYSCDFENGYCDFAEQSALGDAPPSSRRSSFVTPGRSAAHGVKLHTEPGDNNVHGSGTWERDDLIKSPDASYCNQGQEEWWAVSVMYPSDYVFPAVGQGGVFIDFHHNASSGLPNFGVEARGESGLRISGYGGAQLNGGQYRVQIADPYGAVNNVTRNAWYDYVFHIKWSSGGDGVSEAWLNGRKILSYSGATLYTGISCYLKLANYHDATGQPSSVIYDRVIRGHSAADVALGPLDGVLSTGATGGTSPGGTSTGGTTTGGTTTPTPTANGGTIDPASATMDASTYSTTLGTPMTFTARILGPSATPTGSVSFASDGGSIPGCGAVSLSGGVALCSTTLATGQHKITGAYSGDSSYGVAMAGPITVTVQGAVATQSASSLNVGGLWWGAADGSQSGWGVNLVQQGPVLFATWFTYDHDGSPMWLVMPDALKAGDGSYSGTLYRTTGPSYRAGSFDPSQVGVTAVGSASFSFSDASNGSFTATVNGTTVSKSLVREVWNVLPTCAADGSQAGMSNFQDLWWRASGAESGWGLQVVQQAGTMFLAWFTYDDNGNGLWLVASNMQQVSSGVYSGALYRTTGPAFDSASWDPSQVGVTQVGTATLAFTSPSDGTFTANVNGSTVVKPISREVFASPATVCR